MKIFTPNKLLKTSHHYYKPFTRYIVSDTELDEIYYQVSKTQLQMSSFNSWERRYGGQDLNGKSVCIYRHNAWGDQLIASALPRYIKMLYPKAITHLYCHPDVLPLWLGNPFLEGSAIPIPIPFDVATNYDYHIFYEGMLEGNSEKDQNCCYDDLFGFAGLRDVPDRYKRPFVRIRPEDYEVIKDLKLDLQRDYIIYHVAPANPNRCYPPLMGVELVKMMVKELKVPVFIVGKTDKFVEHANYAKLFEGIDGTVNLIDRTKSFRDLIPIVEHSSLVVCPDSAVMHLAACFPHVPVISLWGLFHPRDRVQYYPNHTAMTGFMGCKHSPCRNHTFKLPLDQCIDAFDKDVRKSSIKYCRALSSIAPEKILEMAAEKMK